MSEDFQSELNQIKASFAWIEAETQDARSSIVDRQAQLTAAARRLANLDSLSSELRSNLLAVKSQCSEIRAALADAKSFPLKS